MTLQLIPGYQVEAVSAPPENLSQLLNNLKVKPSAPKSLAVSYETGQGAVAYGGVVAENLPQAALDRVTTESSSLSVSQFSARQFEFYSMPTYLVGSDKISFKVKHSHQ